METDLLFTQGIDLPGFASYPLLETVSGRRHLRRYLEDLIQLGRRAGTGVILESATWVANRDRGLEIGYAADTVMTRNRQAIDLLAEVRDANDDVAVVLSANVGPRTDAYAPSDQMSSGEAELYHCEQVGVLADTKVDLICGYTLGYLEEAVGIVLAARQFDLPVVIAFTVETDGRLPTGMPLEVAIQAVDRTTDNYASYFMINCAHPDHFFEILSDDPWMQRLRGIVANASRCNHAELDEATYLDDGNPEELGRQLAEIHHKYPQINVLGGCCGTDMRHMACIAEAALTRAAGDKTNS
ncbi:homocysteine S-methyltransferase family protein [Litoreibacter halocynthiae]|uniref:homocysteine S-methyltransferase family protein n=1 Tax=Litoreibacter halocynthiae TaxID=1242689 RepID=UPI0024912962|nr:homocysteine S-methyltransferase family protein [Litoreibacter halocynthiae]